MCSNPKGRLGCETSGAFQPSFIGLVVNGGGRGGGAIAHPDFKKENS
jgi:hypothetical protein